jgi:serine/threonine-protein kinase
VKTCGSCGEVYEDDAVTCKADGAPLHAWSQPTVSTGDIAQADLVTVGERTRGGVPKRALLVTGLSDGRVLGGRYLLRKLLGVGGFGAVFEAEDQRLQKRVAVKILSPHVATNPDTLRRFEREALAATRIGHEGIVDVTDFDRDADGTHFLAMEYLDGRDLAQVISREGPLPATRALSIALQVSESLAAAHAKGILHRDLKPANIYLTQRGGLKDYVKILDFGISKMLHTSADPMDLTGTGQILGTPYYMSPEQASGERAIDGRADVYALGVILYEMLTQKLPFVGATYLAVISQHLTREPSPPSQSLEGTSLDPDVDELVLGALKKQPDLRFSSMEELGRAIAQVLSRLDPSLRARFTPTSPVQKDAGGALATAPTLPVSLAPMTPSVGASGPARTFRLRGGRRVPWIVAGAALAMALVVVVSRPFRGQRQAPAAWPGPLATGPKDAAPRDLPPRAAPELLSSPRMIRIVSPVRGAEVRTSDGAWRPLPVLVPVPTEATGASLPVRAVGYRAQPVLLVPTSPDEVGVELQRVGSRHKPSTSKDLIEKEW